jgi:hypothetical protein
LFRKSYKTILGVEIFNKTLFEKRENQNLDMEAVTELYKCTWNTVEHTPVNHPNIYSC